MPRRSFKDYLNKSADEVDIRLLSMRVTPAIRDEDRERLMDMERVSKENAQAKRKTEPLVGRIVYPPFREGWGHIRITEEDKRRCRGAYLRPLSFATVGRKIVDTENRSLSAGRQ
ncbi:MAG: hypothetical protein R3F28_12240 [Candidatus Kapaibacterium sp.]